MVLLIALLDTDCRFFHRCDCRYDRTPRYKLQLLPVNRCALLPTRALLPKHPPCEAKQLQSVSAEVQVLHDKNRIRDACGSWRLLFVYILCFVVCPAPRHNLQFLIVNITIHMVGLAALVDTNCILKKFDGQIHRTLR